MDQCVSVKDLSRPPSAGTRPTSPGLPTKIHVPIASLFDWEAGDSASVNVLRPKPAHSAAASAHPRFVLLNLPIIRILSFIWFRFSTVPARLGAHAERPKLSSNLMIVCPYAWFSPSPTDDSAS